MLTLMPAGLTDRTSRPGDDEFVTVTGRRPALEFAVAACPLHAHLLDGEPITGVLGMLELPRQVMGRPRLADRIMRIADGRPAVAPRGPSRDQILRMLA